MALDNRSFKEGSETLWTWVTRICAVGGFIALIIGPGIDHTPWGFYIMLIGLFFGPDVMRSQLPAIRGRNKDDDGS